VAAFHIPVSLTWDCTMGVLRHDAIQPGTPPVPVPSVISIELFTNQAWPGGLAFNNHKFSKKVLHYGSPVAMDGHNCGPGIMDLTPPVPANLKYPVIWLGSSRKFTFSSATVEHDGDRVGCAAMWPTFPMTTCGDPISGPLALINGNMMNSEKVGVTWGDVLVGLAAAAVSIAIDYFYDKWKPPGPDKPWSLGDDLAKSWVSNNLFPLDGASWLKWGANQLSEVVLSTVTTDTDGDLKVQWPNVSMSLGRFSGGYDIAKGEGAGKISFGVFEIDLAKEEGTFMGSTI